MLYSAPDSRILSSQVMYCLLLFAHVLCSQHQKLSCSNYHKLVIESNHLVTAFALHQRDLFMQAGNNQLSRISKRSAGCLDNTSWVCRLFARCCRVASSQHRYCVQKLQAVQAVSAQQAPESKATMMMGQHAPLFMRELTGTQRIGRGQTVSPLPDASEPTDLMGVTFRDASDNSTCLGDFMQANDADGLLVMHHGHNITEWYADGIDPSTSHGIASITRNFVGSCVAILLERQQLDLDTPVEQYIPELQNTGYAGATVRHLLDMRSGVSSSMILTAQAMRWSSPPDPARPAADGIHELLLSLPKDTDHGGLFKYRAGDTDLLGCLCERVTGKTMAEVISQLIWQPMGAEQDGDMVVDHKRTPMYSGGMSTTLRDAARFGLLWLNEGSCNGNKIVPAAFVHDTRHGNEDVMQAFSGSFFGLLDSPGKMYHNQTWNLDEKRGTLLMYGAGGNIIYIDPPAQLVCTVQSHWPGPFMPDRVQGWLNALEAVRSMLA